jgi:peptidoglycan/xylan/chitin deacetylase (PgdA/CDA1 family)
MRSLIKVFCVVVLLSLVPTMANAEKRIVLSYDDPPRGDGRLYSGDERTAQLIDGLEAANAGSVLFFVSTQGIEANETGLERLRAYAEADHLLANHTHKHMWAHKTPVEAYLADVDQAASYLADLPNTRPWFRFPFLDEGREPDRISALSEGLDARGLSNGYVTVDTYDWHLERRFQTALKNNQSIDYDALGELYIRLSLESAAFYDEIAQETLGKSPVHVLLLHENDLAARYAQDLVIAFREAGWKIVHPDEAYSDPLPAPETHLTGQGRVAALAIDQGRDPRTIVHWGIQETAIDDAINLSGSFEVPVSAD